VLTRRGFGAITFGHVAQYERLGLSFLPLYLWYRARYGYAEHPLERDASEDPRLFS